MGIKFMKRLESFQKSLGSLKKAKNKTENEILQGIQLLEEQLKEQKEGQKGQKAQLDEIQDAMQKLLSRQRKSETVAENILEVMEEHTDAFLSRNHIKSNEKVLAGYILDYEESLYQMERMLVKSGEQGIEWAKQIGLLQNQLRKKMKEMQLYIIQDIQVPIDFEIHEVAGIQSTSDYNRKDAVCDIILPGLLYQGEVLKKAKVTAYKYEEATKE